MKKTLFTLLFLLGLLIATESSAQRSRSYRYRHYVQPRVRVYVAPRLFAPPAIGFGWNRGGVFIAPPPVIIGRGLGWRHYHRRGMRCNDRCCRRIDEYERGYNRGYNERRYDDRRDDRYDERYDRNRRYDDSRNDDRRRDDDRRYNQNRNEDRPERINTDEDVYEEVENDTY